MAAPIGPKKVHRYRVEFKIQAVRLSLHPEIQTQDVAHALDTLCADGVPSTLYGPFGDATSFNTDAQQRRCALLLCAG